MTDKVNPSENRKALSLATAGAIALGGGERDGWISPSGQPSVIATKDTDIDETTLDDFSITTSTSSLDVTIGSGEAFVYGSWVVTESSRNVSLDASTSGQTIALSWDTTATDTVQVDKASNLSEPTLELYDVDTDSTGVTGTTDRRTLGPSVWESISVTTDYTAYSYEHVLADASSNAVTVTLPRPTTDLMVTVKATDATNDVTIATPESQTIDGSASRTISSQYTALTITADGTNYFIV